MTVTIGIHTNNAFKEITVEAFNCIYELDSTQSICNEIASSGNYRKFVINDSYQYSFVGSSTCHVNGKNISYINFVD